MLTKEIIKNLLYADVETTSFYKTLEVMITENPRLYELWKIREEYFRRTYSELKEATSNEIYKNRAGLEPEFSRIVCVSFGTFDKEFNKKMISFYGDDEIEILEKTNKVLTNGYLKGYKLCGHNIKGFDIPCIGKRMLYNKINPSKTIQVWDKKPWEVNAIDTAELVSFGSWAHQKYVSLDMLTCSFGIDSPKEKMKGSDVNDEYWINNNIEGIKEYCERDVIAVMEILEFLCMS